MTLANCVSIHGTCISESFLKAKNAHCFPHPHSTLEENKTA